MGIVCSHTVNCEIFVVKIFSDSMDNAKIKHMKIEKLCALLVLMQYGVAIRKILNTKLTRSIHDLLYIYCE